MVATATESFDALVSEHMRKSKSTGPMMDIIIEELREERGDEFVDSVIAVLLNFSIPTKAIEKTLNDLGYRLTNDPIHRYRHRLNDWASAVEIEAAK